LISKRWKFVTAETERERERERERKRRGERGRERKFDLLVPIVV
jgi:hypothetical protein